MKTAIHPEYKRALITCACGRVTETRSTVEELHVEICSHCHPFFTGRQKLVDTAGRVERFMAKYGMDEEAAAEAAEAVAEREAESERQELPEEIEAVNIQAERAAEAHRAAREAEEAAEVGEVSPEAGPEAGEATEEEEARAGAES